MGPSLYSQDLAWKEFFPGAFARLIERQVDEEWWHDGARHWHVDIWQPPPDSPIRPTIVYCHGLSSSGRMMANFAKPFHDRGYRVVCPDLPGFGLSLVNGRRGCATVDEMAQVLAATATQARARFGDPVFLAGISLGGALSYYAAALGAPVKGVAALNLMDMGDPLTHAISERGRWLAPLIPLMRLMARMMPELPLPLSRFLNVDKLSDDPELVERFRAHPQIVKSYTLRAALSLLTARPKISFEEFDAAPILVLHGRKDRLIPEHLTRANFERLKGPKKYVVLDDAEHVPLHARAAKQYADAVASWFSTLS